MRKLVKVHENTVGLKIIYNMAKKQIVHTDERYKTFYLTKYTIDNIVYDEHVVACFYSDVDHPMSPILGKNFIKMAKMFSNHGMTVILSHIKDEFAHFLIFPNHQVKIFH